MFGLGTIQISAALGACLSLVACGLQAPDSPPLPRHPDRQVRDSLPPPAQNPAVLQSSEIELFCADVTEFLRSWQPVPTPPPRVEEAADDRERIEIEPLPGMSFLPLDRAPENLTPTLLDRRCSSAARIWAVSIPGTGPRPHNLLFAATDGYLFDLPDGRQVFLAPATEGNYHAATGSFLAFILREGQPLQRRPFLMGGGGTFGGQGLLMVPSQQPLGVFHVWQQGGGTWQGYTQSWASITDFAGSEPRDVGSFRTGVYMPCQHDGPLLSGPCRGGVEYDLTLLQYSANGPDQLTLRWRKIEFDENARGVRVHVRESMLSATYELRGGRYRLVHGEEPPSI